MGAADTMVHIEIKASPFKNVVALMKELLTDVQFIFRRGYLEIIGLDAESVSILKARIPHEMDLSEDVIVGSYLTEFYKFLRNAEKDDTILLGVEDSPQNFQYLVCRLNSEIHERRSWYKFPHVQVDSSRLVFPEIRYDQCLTFKTTNLQKALREIAYQQSTCQQKVVDITISEAKGFSMSTFSILQGGGSVTLFPENVVCGYHGTFYSRYLLKFLRVAVAAEIQMYLKQGGPLVLAYTMEGSTVEIAIAPI